METNSIQLTSFISVSTSSISCQSLLTLVGPLRLWSNCGKWTVRLVCERWSDVYLIVHISTKRRHSSLLHLATIKLTNIHSHRQRVGQSRAPMNTQHSMTEKLRHCCCYANRTSLDFRSTSGSYDLNWIFRLFETILVFISYLNWYIVLKYFK